MIFSLADKHLTSLEIAITPYFFKITKHELKEIAYSKAEKSVFIKKMHSKKIYRLAVLYIFLLFAEYAFLENKYFNTNLYYFSIWKRHAIIKN